MRSLRELHDKYRIVHLQPHLSNFYLIENTPYIADWGTMRPLGKNRMENVLNRATDINRPPHDIAKIFERLFPGEETHIFSGMVETQFILKSIDEYLGGGKRHELLALSADAGKTFGADPKDYQTIAQALINAGLEGFLGPELTKNVGRNECCPCGSGKKFKKCHG